MRRSWKYTPLAALALFGAAGCDDFLSGGELDTDPNNPTEATTSQYFVGVQSNLWALLTGDPARVTNLWVQYFTGGGIQYAAYGESYDISESTTNGSHQSMYLGGGLVDIRNARAGAAEVNDSLFVGITQVQEAILMGTGADLFGDLVYSNALGEANPELDSQLEVYDHVIALLDTAITNLAATGVSNVGPGAADLSYGGDPELWTKLAYTLKARFLAHTAEVRGAGVYAQVLEAASQGITDPEENFIASFSGAAFEQNFWYQFVVTQRPGDLTPSPTFVDTLRARNDPRLGTYFNATQTNLSSALLSEDYAQPLIKAEQNLLLWAEAAQRTGNNPVALQQLNAERQIAGFATPLTGLTGDALLSQILIEKWIANFQTVEGWADYKRTCRPNLAPRVAGAAIPARLFYDTNERQTNTNMPSPEAQEPRNENDPANAVGDGSTVDCFGQ